MFRDLNEDHVASRDSFSAERQRLMDFTAPSDLQERDPRERENTHHVKYTLEFWESTFCFPNF